MGTSLLGMGVQDRVWLDDLDRVWSEVCFD